MVLVHGSSKIIIILNYAANGVYRRAFFWQQMTSGPDVIINPLHSRGWAQYACTELEIVNK